VWTGDRSGATEVATHHLFVDSNEARFPQAFVFETDGEVLTRFQAYSPHPPPVQD
jgi:hypothetical protein